MTDNFLTAFFSVLPVFPAALLCYAPMQGQTKQPLRIIAIRAFCILTPIILITAYLQSRFALTQNLPAPFLIIITFALYHRSLKSSFAKNIAVYASVCTIMAFMLNIAVGYDTIIHPASDLNHFSLQAALLRFILSLLAAGLLYRPFRIYGQKLINSYVPGKVWYIAFLITAIFMILNIFITPLKYETLHVNKVFLAFWICVFLSFSLYMLLILVFNYIIDVLLTYAEINDRNRILEMIESRYQTQQRYLEESARVRHDFKHTVHTLKELADTKDIEAINSYLDSYLKDLPTGDARPFTPNPAVNAVLNYYLQTALKNGIKAEWNISYPSSTPISDADICSILGNILENAILACSESLQENPFIDLTLDHEKGSSICIAVANSLGTLKIRNGQYLTTHKNGQGIGLNSIRTIASKYKGTARFSHEGNEFYSEVILPMPPSHSDT